MMIITNTTQKAGKFIFQIKMLSMYGRYLIKLIVEIIEKELIKK